MRSAHSPIAIICRGHTFGVTGVAWSPDGTRLASASADGTARLWDPSTSEALGQVGTPRNWPIHTIAWSPDGRHIALGDEQGYLQVAGEQGSIVHAVQPFVHPPHLGSIRSVAWSPNRGDALASGSASGQIRVWSLGDRQLRLLSLLQRTGVLSLAWSPDGCQIICGLMKGACLVTPGTDTTTTLVTGVSVQSVAWSPNGAFIAATAGQDVLMWDVHAGEEIARANHVAAVSSVAWSPDSRRIAAGSDDATVHIWKAATGKRVAAYRGHSGPVLAVAWSPDGRQIASGSQDGAVHLWEAAA